MKNKKWRLLGIWRSRRRGKKFEAVFENLATGRTKTVHFGARGYEDYTTHKDPERKERYLQRHKRENWKDPTTPGALARWILWNKPTLRGSLRDYRRRFGV